MLIISYVILLILQTICNTHARNNEMTFIIGGEKIKIENAPWNVAIFFNNNFHCGGSIISDRWILSAAHCFYNFRGFPMTMWTVSYGIDNLKTKLFKKNVKRIINHEYFDKPFFSNDIALLELQEVIKLEEHKISSILLWKDNFHFHDINCKVFGFGFDGINSFSPDLKAATVSILEEISCQKLYCKPTKDNEILPIYKSNICAQNITDHSDSCKGDSGGGLIYQEKNGKNLLLGITSHGEGCGLTDRPGIYTKVQPYLPWISHWTKLYFNKFTHPYKYNEEVTKRYFKCIDE